MKTLTFSDTLHPETVDIAADPQNGSSTTVWGTVMKEIRTDLPVAVAVEERNHCDPASAQVSTISNDHGDEEVDMPKGKGCFYIEGLVGCSLTFAAVVANFGVELAAAVCYCLAAGIYFLISGENIPIVFKAIAMLIVHALMVVDALLLTVNLILTEVLGWTTAFVTSIFSLGCYKAGRRWHHYIRKVCHLTRWAFRGFHQGWPLERRFPRLDFGESGEVGCEPDSKEEHGKVLAVSHDMETDASSEISMQVQKEARKRVQSYQV